MKFVWFAGLFAGLAYAQAEPKHVLLAAANGSRSVASASSIERGAHYPGVVRLKGNVEIKTSLGGGYMIVRADEAVYHEDTGAIEPAGHVSVVPLLRQEKK